MKKRRKKRIISLTMVLALCLTLFPTSALAAEDSGAAIVTGGLCVHHTEHDEACGYVEGTEESPCTHQHSEECYHEVTSCTHEHTPDCYPAEDSSIPEDGTTSSEDTETPEATPSEPAEPTACSHVCSEENGCIKQELDCRHEHNEECGYAPAVEGQPCTYVCTLCGMTEITAWSWVDTQDVLDPESGVLALSASAESPVLYEDIVDLLPVEIEATTAGGTETLSLDGWSCDDYPAEGAYTGSYAFHAVLPEGYGLAADAPALTVTVELDDEVMLMAAGTTHAKSHPPCGASCTHGNSHPNDYYDNWLASDYGTDAKSLVLRVGGSTSTYGDPLKISGDAWVLPAGTYYLKDDIHIDKTIRIEEEVTICLNGHDIYIDKEVAAFKIVRKNPGSRGGKLKLTDCQERCGEIKSNNTDNRGNGVIIPNGTFDMYGGTIKGTKVGVSVRESGAFNMYGGVISDIAGSGVIVTDSTATFKMYGGEISRNTGYGVDVEKYATFDMYSGEIKDDIKNNRIGVFCRGGKFNMCGGVISGYDRGVHATCSNGTTIIPSTFKMTGGTIKGNETGVSLCSYFNGKGFSTDDIIKKSTFTMTAGEIINNTEIGVDMGVYHYGSDSGAGGSLSVGGTAKIQNNGEFGNVYFSNGEIKLASSESLTEGAYIGITTPSTTLPTEENPLLIASNLYSQQYEVADYFHSDRDGYVIKCTNTDGSHTTHTLNLTVSPHTHNWVYTNVDKSTISVTCTSTVGTCNYQTNPPTVKISTAQTTYGSETITEAPKAVLTHSDNWPDGLAKAQESAIEYYKSADGGLSHTVRVYDNKDLKNPGKYVAQLLFNGKYLETYFSVVDNRKQDPAYTAPTAKTGLTYNGQTQALITPGSTNDGTMQYKLGTGAYSTTLPTATNAGDYTVYYKVVGDATHNDTAEQSITVKIGKAPLTGSPTFTPVTEAGKTIADVTLTAPTGWPAGTFYWMSGEIGLEKTTPIKQGTPYHWVFIPTDNVNYQSIGGDLVLWKDTSGGSSSNPGGGSSGGGSSSNSGGGSSGGGSISNTSSSSTPLPSTPVTVPVSGDEKTIQVNAAVRDTTATIQNVDLSKLNTVIGDTVKTGVVTIDFSALKKVDTVKLPSNVVNQFAAAVNDPNNHAKGLEIVLTNGISVELGAGVLGEKALQAKVSDITISSRPLTDNSLNSSLSNSLNGSLNSLQMLAVGNRPAFDINITIGGKPISDIGGEVTVSASYELNPGEQSDGIVVYYVDENGSKQLCETSYDPIRKQVSWKTNPLSPSSVYMIGYDEKKLVKPDTDAYAVYTVQKGNTLSAIAKKHGCTVADIIAANSDLIKNPNRIHVGWQLKIPQK